MNSARIAAVMLLAAICGPAAARGQQFVEFNNIGVSLGSPVLEMMKKYPNGDYVYLGEEYIQGVVRKGAAVITVCYKDRKAISITMRLGAPQNYNDAGNAFKAKFGKPETFNSYSASWQLPKDRGVRIEGQNFEGDVINGYLTISDFVRSEQAGMFKAITDNPEPKKVFEK